MENRDCGIWGGIRFLRFGRFYAYRVTYYIAYTHAVAMSHSKRRLSAVSVHRRINAPARARNTNLKTL